MKMSLWDRILVILTALIDIAMVVLTGLRMIGLDLAGEFMQGVQATSSYGKYLVFAFLALVVVLNVMVIVFMFRRQNMKRAERNFVVVDAGEKGRIRIAMDALEGMVRHASDNMQSAHNIEIHLQNQEDAIAIGLNMDLEMGVHVPTATMNLQRDIREYVETNCGIAVRTVSIDVHKLIEQTKKAAEPEMPTEPTMPMQTYEQPVAEAEPFQTAQPVEEEPMQAEQFTAEAEEEPEQAEQSAEESVESDEAMTDTETPQTEQD